MEHLWYIYGPLEGRTVYYTVHPTDRKLLNNRHRQIAAKLPMLRYRWKMVEKLRWNLVDLYNLLNFIG